MRSGMWSGVLVALAAVVLGCATGGSKMSTEEAIKERQALMKEQGKAAKSISDKVKAGQTDAIGPDADTLAETSKKITALFPPGSIDPNVSRAKPEIWQKWSEFEGYAKSLETKAKQLAATSRSGAAKATTAQACELGKTTCGGCHTAFRGPEIKK